MEPPSTGAESGLEARPPLQRHLQILADQFCPCGYNLHGQRVTFDERLDIPVVRCPECGRWSAAGHGSTATRSWLARLGSVALFIWIMMVLGAILATLLLVFGMCMARTVGNTVVIALTPDGRQITQTLDPNTGVYAFTYAGSDEQVNVTRIQYKLRQVPAGDPRAKYPFYNWYAVEPMPRSVYLMFLGIAGGGGLLLGIFLAAALWHLRSWRRWGLPTLMLLPGLATMAILHLDDAFELMVAPAWKIVATTAGGAALAMLVGLAIGRSVARAIVIGIVPPRPRQMLAFLWLADGKTPPPATE